jgi:hypothetical protein
MPDWIVAVSALVVSSRSAVADPGTLGGHGDRVEGLGAAQTDRLDVVQRRGEIVRRLGDLPGRSSSAPSMRWISAVDAPVSARMRTIDAW